MKDDICVNKSAEIEIDTDVSSLSIFSVVLFAQKTEKIKRQDRSKLFAEEIWWNSRLSPTFCQYYFKEIHHQSKQN